MPKSVGVNKLNSRWKAGVWLGIKEDSGKTLIGTKEGFIKVRSIRRRAGNLKWDVEMLESMKGLPWQPVPGRDSIEPSIKIGVPEE